MRIHQLNSTDQDQGPRGHQLDVEAGQGQARAERLARGYLIGQALGIGSRLAVGQLEAQGPPGSIPGPLIHVRELQVTRPAD